MSEHTIDLEIDLQDVRTAIAKFDRETTERSVMRMLASGIRTAEIMDVSEEVDRREIRRIVEQAFPDKTVYPHDFRKVLAAGLLSGGLSKRTTQIVLDHDSRMTAELSERCKICEEDDRDWETSRAVEQIEIEGSMVPVCRYHEEIIGEASMRTKREEEMEKNSEGDME